MKNKAKIIGFIIGSIIIVSGIVINVSHVYLVRRTDTNGNNNDNDDDPPINPNNETSIPGSFYSEIIKDTFEIYLSLPENYNETDNKQYPMIILLDSDMLFYGSSFLLNDGGVSSIISHLQENNSIPDVILIGIGYPGGYDIQKRNRDFMYPANIFPPGSGGAFEFYLFLETEFIPYVESHFPTNITFGHTLIGDSYGGNFGLFSLFHYATNTTSLFRNNILISPSVSYADYYLLSIEEDLFNRTNGVLPIQLHLSAGANEWGDMVQGVELLNHTMTNRNYQDFIYSYQLYEDKDHLSVLGPAIREGLHFIFS